jgi:predicted SAM-dependent methyltransferase
MLNFQVRTLTLQDAETGERREIRIGAVTSVPRLAFTAHWSELHKAFDGMNIPVLKVTGYSWGASLQRGVNMLVEAGCDYVITIDYDSIFSHEDIAALIALAARYPDADAIFPWQVKRGGVDRLLLGLRDAEGKPLDVAPARIFSGEMTICESGHFGLTLLKVEALKRTPKPWFWEQPNADGEWEDGKVDADMWFWQRFVEAGHKACLATNVRIGHIDEDILWPSEGFQVVRQSVSDFYKNGRPSLKSPPAVADSGVNRYLEDVKLNLGAGEGPLPGYQNIDRKTGGEIFPLSYADNSASEVRASHVLEHFPHGQVADVVREWARVLKPGGKLKIAVPDFDYIVKAYSNGRRDDRMLELYLFGGQVDDADYHKAFFNEEKLAELMKHAGLGSIEKWQSEIQDCASLEVSLNLQGVKLCLQ